MFWMEKNEKLIIKGGVGTPIRHSRVGTRFRLKMTLLNFCIKLTQKACFRTKKIENYHGILHIQINIDSKIQLQNNLDIWNKFKKKKNFRSKTHKNEHAIATIWTKFPKRVTIFSLKQIK